MDPSRPNPSPTPPVPHVAVKIEPCGVCGGAGMYFNRAVGEYRPCNPCKQTGSIERKALVIYNR